MPVPSDITVLSTTPGSNSPPGGETPNNMDDYLRSLSAFIAQVRAVIGGTVDANIPNASANTALVSDYVTSQSQNSGTTGGTLTAYTLTPATALTSYSAGKTFWVTFHAASGASPTLTISGVATPPNLVRQLSDGTFANIGAGEIPINHRSRVTLISASQALVEDMPPSLGPLDTLRIDVASASTVNLTSSAPDTRHINITGTTTIAGFTVAAGQCYFVRFDGALTLTNNANIVTQTGADITTVAGDTCIIRATAANVVEVLAFAATQELSLGVGQTWQDVLGSRSGGTTYTNSTGRTIAVSISSTFAGDGDDLTLTVGGVTVSRQTVGSGTTTQLSVFAVVPDGATYSVSSGRSLAVWSELR